MKISTRLSAIADMVRHTEVVDVGTDHAYLPIHLAKTCKAQRVIATDIAIGPLERATENVLQHGVGDVVETRLCNGLEGILTSDDATCIIAGMGGMLIIDILKQNLSVALSFKQLIFSPQRDVPHLRHFLHNSGFAIDNEMLLENAGRFYHILDCSVGTQMPFSNEGYLFGEHLINSNSAEFAKYLHSEAVKTTAALTNVAIRSPRYLELQGYLQLCSRLTSEVLHD